MPTPHQPPFTITPRIVALVAEICERVGRWTGEGREAVSPRLRRENRIRTIQASLAIENNTLSIEQVTAILEGKRVLGTPREIQEVRNAIECYDRFGDWQATSAGDLLVAHGIMMKALVDEAGGFRRGGVGIYRGDKLVHMAPPADRVEHGVRDLLRWLETTDHHPLVASSILHYEIEFIHPFADGNGRMGRLWQSLALASWHADLAYLPVEHLISERQADYYAALGEADRRADASPFVEFMLSALRDAFDSLPTSDQVNDQVNDQVKSLVRHLSGSEEVTAAELMRRLDLKHRPSFRKNYLHPALVSGWIEMTDPSSPRSPAQRYRLTARGRRQKH
ncbi:Fic family protein [Luteolibacter arcticus]|uniref:Fic family protein n=1 Tax=Luteolibacter arcticus TaxID=1581411 RepID=A0ABT3GHS7_9BACT|nr:Fic family protein [Luteolibacter arcticus]MCW1923055.1 Fic family protein [Luteolibacter arcticus]